jgi:hypothetical protein
MADPVDPRKGSMWIEETSTQIQLGATRFTITRHEARDPLYEEGRARMNVFFSQDEIHSFFKEEAHAKHVTTLTIHDLIPEKIRAFAAFYKEKVISVELEVCRANFNQTLYQTSPLYSLETMHPVARATYEGRIEENTQRMLSLRIHAFLKENRTLGEINTLFPSRMNISGLVVSPCDFKGINVPVNPDAVAFEERRLGLRKKAEVRRAQEGIQHYQAWESRIQSQNLDRNLLLIRFFTQVASHSKKPLEELESADLNGYMQLLDENIKAVKEQLAERAAQELLKEELQKQGAGSKKNKQSPQIINHQNAKQETLPTLPKPMQAQPLSTESSPSVPPSWGGSLKERVEQLNRHPSSAYTLHPRILRWNTADIGRIKQFEDKDPLTGNSVKKYEQFTKEQLLLFKQNHQLSGIQYLLSDPSLSNDYSFCYRFKNEGGEMREGRGLYASKQDHGKCEHGVVYVAIGKDAVIYHALFEPFKDTSLVPQQLAKPFSIAEDFTLKSEEWQQTDAYLFSFIEGENLIQMSIGKKAQHRVIFNFYPLKSNSEGKL